MPGQSEFRVELTSKGWCYQAFRNFGKARRCPDADEATVLKEKALYALKLAVQLDSQRVRPSSL